MSKLINLVETKLKEMFKDRKTYLDKERRASKYMNYEAADCYNSAAFIITFQLFANNTTNNEERKMLDELFNRSLFYYSQLNEQEDK